LDDRKPPAKNNKSITLKSDDGDAGSSKWVAVDPLELHCISSVTMGMLILFVPRR
jgi:hypothetical protein